MHGPAGDWSNTWGDGPGSGPVPGNGRDTDGSAAGRRNPRGRRNRQDPGRQDPGNSGTSSAVDDARDPHDARDGDRGGGDVTGTGADTPGARPRRGRRGARGGSPETAPDPATDPEGAARAICLRLLTGRARTRAQLADALRRRDIPDEVAAHVLGRFTDVGLIDDTAFAAAWVDTRHLGRGLARRALARELRQRGVDAAVVDEAVQRLDPEQERETARALVERRLPATRGLDRDKRIRRLAGMLARKGYGEGLALRTVREALEAEAADLGEDPAGPGHPEDPAGADDAGDTDGLFDPAFDPVLDPVEADDASAREAGRRLARSRSGTGLRRNPRGRNPRWTRYGD